MIEKILRAMSWLLLPAMALAATQYGYFAPGGALSCTGNCTAQSVDLNSGGFLLNTLPNAKLANSTFTLNGASVSLGGSRTLNLASADFANQGTVTTVLHGNAAGNTSFGPVDLANDITSTLGVVNGGTGVTTSTGSGNTVLSTSPTLVTPALGTPSALVLTNATALPDSALSINVPLLNASNSFTGTSQQISNTEPRLKLNQSGAGSDLKLWDIDVSSAVLCVRTRTDADGAGVNVMCATRGTTTTITNESFGNATNNPTYSFLGSGSTTFTGQVSSDKINISGATSFSCPSNGIYVSTSNTPGACSNGVERYRWTSAGISITSGALAVSTVGSGLQVKEGTNGKQGTCTLVAGTCTVSTTSVTANSRIFLTAQSLGTVSVPSGYGISARVAGTSFTVLASVPTDTSVIAYELLEPAP